MIRRALKAGVFFGAICGTGVFVAFLFGAGSGFRLITLAAWLSGTAAGFVAFLIPPGRFPVLIGLLSGALTLLALAPFSMAVTLLLEGHPLQISTVLAGFRMSLPLIGAFSTYWVFGGALLGGGFVRYQMISAGRNRGRG